MFSYLVLFDSYWKRPINAIIVSCGYLHVVLKRSHAREKDHNAFTTKFQAVGETESIMQDARKVLSVVEKKADASPSEEDCSSRLWRVSSPNPH